MINKVIMLGTFIDFSYKYTINGNIFIQLVIATRYGKTTDFHKIFYFETNYERANLYVKMLSELKERRENKTSNGDYIYIEGRISYYERQIDTITIKMPKIIANRIMILSGKRPDSIKSHTESITEHEIEEDLFAETSVEPDTEEDIFAENFQDTKEKVPATKFINKHDIEEDFLIETDVEPNIEENTFADNLLDTEENIPTDDFLTTNEDRDDF